MPVEGYYNRNPATGELEIKTVYPQSNPQQLTFPDAPSSYPKIPQGYVTPPDYSCGDNDSSESDTNQ